MLLSLLASALLTAEPGPIAVVATSKRVGAESFGPKVAARVLELLRREGLAGTLDDAETLRLLKKAEFPDPRACNGGQKCTQRLAVLLGATAVVVSVDVAKVGKLLTVHVEAYSATKPTPLATADVSAPVDSWKEQTAVDVVTFARSLKTALAEPSPVVTDVPKKDETPTKPPEVVLTPSEPTKAPVAVSTNVAPAPSRTLAWVTLGAAGASLAASAAFLVLGSLDKNQLNARLFTDPLTGAPAFRGTEAERQQLVASGNLKFTLALTTAIVGGALGAVGTWLLVKE